MRKLKTILFKKSGRNFSGKISVRHQGGRNKRFLREIDFKRSKKDKWGVVSLLEVDPNRNARIALVIYSDGERRYTLAPAGLTLGQKIIASETAPIEAGNSLPLKAIPIGTQVHNLEIRPQKGGQMVRGAGVVAVVQGKEVGYVLVRMPSGELRKFNPECWVTVGQLSNFEDKTKRLSKAGQRRRMGIRPTVRGVAMHPHAHPHGGGEGRSSVGMKFPKTRWGRPAVGKTRKHRKYSDSTIIEPRKKGKHV